MTSLTRSAPNEGSISDSPKFPNGDFSLVRFAERLCAAAESVSKNTDQEIALPMPDLDLDIDGTKGYFGRLRDAVAARMNLPATEAVAIVLREFASMLDAGPWLPLESRHSHGGRADYVGTAIPFNAAFADAFRAAGSFARFSDRGKSSFTQGFPCCPEIGRPALPNAWVTAIRAPEGQVFFEGIRSGSLVHHGERDTARREKEAVRAAEELLAAAAAMSFSRLTDADVKSVIDRAKALPITIVSVDLQSTGADPASSINIENWIVPEQRRALRSLEGVRSIELQLGSQGDSAFVTIDAIVEVLPFNLPTHHHSLRNGSGFDEATIAMNRGSWARLAGLADEENRLRQGTLHPDSISALLEQGHRLMHSNLARISADPYGASSRTLLLASSLGCVPHFNCRSGKDRTGMLDAELKLLAVQAASGAVPDIDSTLSEEDRALLFDLAMTSGSAEIQRLNTGVPGSKLKPLTKDPATDPLVARIGVDRWSVFKGYSGLARL